MNVEPIVYVIEYTFKNQKGKVNCSLIHHTLLTFTFCNIILTFEKYQYDHEMLQFIITIIHMHSIMKLRYSINISV